MHLQSTIEELGYSPHEAQVYLAALKLGGSTVTELAAKVKMPRTSVQLIIDGLHRKGLMNTFLQHKRKLWVAENPDRLLMSLKEREAALSVVLPELRGLRHEGGVKPAVSTYAGPAEIRQIMEDILAAKHPISAILSWDEWAALMGESFLKDFIETRVRHFLKMRLITPKTNSSLAVKLKDAQELRLTEFLPPQIEINNANFIYADKVAVIALNTKRPTGILIEDKDIHHTMEALFDSLWRESGG